MRSLCVASAIILVVYGAPTSTNDKDAEIVLYKYENDGTGNYFFSFKTSNGLSRVETGILVDAGTPTQRMLVRGTFVYITPDGNEEAWSYTADENGYHQQRKLTNFVGYKSFPPGVVASLLGK